MNAAAVAGWIGAALLLICYGLVATKRMVVGRGYHALNGVGSAGLAVNGVVNHACQARRST